MDKEASAAVGRIRTTLDRIGGVWSAVEGVATFNTAEMEADIRAVLEAYETVVAERDALRDGEKWLVGTFKAIKADRDELRAALKTIRNTADVEIAASKDEAPNTFTYYARNITRDALVGEKEGNQDAGK